MANITPYTNQIRTARYGEEVRGSIVNALEAMNTDINNDTASARSYANAASANATTCQSISDNLQSVIQSVEQTEATIEAAETQRQEAEATRQATETGYVAQCRNYAERAENAVLRYGVTQFNGRTGAVTPADGDYSADMISYGEGGTVSGKFESVDNAIAENATAISNNTASITENAEDISDLQDKTTYEYASGTAGSSSSVSGADYKTCRLVKAGKHVTCYVGIGYNNGTTPLGGGTSNIFFTVPTGHEPKSNSSFPAMAHLATGVVRMINLTCNTSGEIYTGTATNCTSIYGTLEWETE